MKKLSYIFGIFILFTTILASCSSGKCKLEGCDKDGIGWHYSRECSGVCRPVGKTYGGFCSKQHALQYAEENPGEYTLWNN